MTRLLLLAALLSACSAYKVRFESRPHGALLSLPDGRSVVLPAEVPMPWRPLRRPVATVEATGYRTLEVRLGPRHVTGMDYLTDPVINPVEAFGDAPRRVVIFHLVPEHGPTGAWTVDDIPSR